MCVLFGGVVVCVFVCVGVQEWCGGVSFGFWASEKMSFVSLLHHKILLQKCVNLLQQEENFLIATLLYSIQYTLYNNARHIFHTALPCPVLPFPSLPC
jgi:hypothetical protein